MTIPYPDMTKLPRELQDFVASRPLNVFRMLMHTPNAAPGYLSLAEGILRGSPLPAALRELIIIRVGHQYGAPYELYHHERLARTAGLSEAGIAAAGIGADAPGLTADEKSVIEWTDAILHDHELVGQQREAAIALFGLNGLADLVMTVGFYQLVCNFLRTFEVAIES